HSDQTLPAVASIGIGPCSEKPGTGAPCGRGGGGGWWSAAVVHRNSFQPTCAVTCLSNVGSSPSAQSSWRMLNVSVSPSILKSSSAAIVYGLSHVPQTMPRSLPPTFLMMKYCFGAPTPNPSHAPMTSFSVSFVFHGPG